MENCERSIKNLDEFEFKYIPKSSFERVIRRIEDNKKKSTNKKGMWGNFYSVSSDLDHSEMAKACYEIEPHQKEMTLNDVYNVLKSEHPMLPSEAAPLFGPPKKLRDRNVRMVGDDNQLSNRNQTTQQVLSTKLKNLQCNKSENNLKATSNTSVHIVEVVNVADVRGPNGSSKIQVTEQITPNDNVNDEKSGIIECSSDNDETLYSEMLDLCNEIEILNEDDGSSVSHHGNEMRKIHSSSKSDEGKEKNKKAKNISEKLICEPHKTTHIDDELDFQDDDDDDKAMWEYDENQAGGGGLRTEFYQSRPETPYECEYPMKQNDKIKTESYVSKAETPMESSRNKVSKNQHNQKKPTRPERPQRPERPPSRHGNRDESIKYHKQSKPQIEENRPVSQRSSSSLENLASQVVKRVDEYQERIYKYLNCIYDIICEPHKTDDIHDFQIRHRRSVEFTNLFVRNHLYQIGRLAENIRAMSGNPIDIVTKVNSLFQLILQGVQSYLKSLEGFIYNNSPDKLLVLTEYIVNAIRVCISRRALSIRDTGIMEILKIIDEIRYCLNSCDKNGHLLPRFYEQMERKRHRKAMQDGRFEGEDAENEQQLENVESFVDELGDRLRSRESGDHQRVLKDSRENSRDNQKNLPKCSSEFSIENFKTLQYEDFDDNQHKKSRIFKDNDKIWNNKAEQRLIQSRGSSSYSNQMQQPKEVHIKPKSVVRKNIYGYPTQSPYDMPSNPYGIPKMRAKPKAAANRSNLSSAKNSAYGSRLSSSRSSMQNHAVNPTKSGHYQPDRRASKGNSSLHPTKSTVYRSNLQSSKSMVQKSGLHPTKSTVNGMTKNAVNNSTKSTVYELKKSSSDVSTALQKEMENGQLSVIEEEDYESDEQSECASKKSLECNEKQSSRCTSRSSAKSAASSQKSDWSSDKDSRKNEKKSLKIDEKMKDKKHSKIDESNQKVDRKKQEIDKNNQKVDKSNQKIEKSSQKVAKNNPKIDIPQPENDQMHSKFIELLEKFKLSQTDPDDLMKIIQKLPKEKFDEMMGPIKAQLVPSNVAKAKEVKKSDRRVKADVEPLKKPGSANSQRSKTERLAPNVQLVLVENDTEDDSDEDEVEVPKAKESKPSSMPKKSKDKKLWNSDSSDEDEDEDDDAEDYLNFDNYTLDELRAMSIAARDRRLERIKNNPFYNNDQIAEPWKLFGQVSDEILDELIESTVRELLAEEKITEQELIDRFLKSELEC